MAHKMLVFVLFQAVIFQAVTSQVLNRVGCGGCGGYGCGCSNILPLPVAEQILPPQYISPCKPVVYEQPTTIIQDSTVANNLANALQLLVVSNLLSNTLPLESCGCGCGCNQLVSAPLLSSPLELLAPGSLASYAPLASLAPCGCGGGCGYGGCGGCGCGYGAYNVIY